MSFNRLSQQRHPTRSFEQVVVVFLSEIFCPSLHSNQSPYSLCLCQLISSGTCCLLQASAFGTSCEASTTSYLQQVVTSCTVRPSLGEVDIAWACREAHDFKVPVTGLSLCAEAVLIIAFFTKVGIPIQSASHAILNHSEER